MIWTFEYFRIYFLICVMFTHLVFLIEPVDDPISRVMSFGTAGVYYFFLLTAFFLYRTLKKHDPKNWKEALNLIFRRIMQYMVLYWIRLILVLIYHLILRFYSGIYTYSLSELVSKFIMDVLMIDIYVPLAYADVGWYFRSLMFCYLLAYPIYRAVIKLTSKKRFVLTLLFFAVHFVMSVCFRNTQYETWKLYYNPYLHLFDFFIGMSIAHSFFTEKENSRFFASQTTATILELTAVGIIVIAQFVMPYHIQSWMPYRYSIYLAIMTFLVYVFSKQAGLLSVKGGNHPVLAFLHKHFFSLYIFHDIVIKYSLFIPWSNSKYLNLAGAIAAIIILDEVLFLPAADRIGKMLKQRFFKPAAASE